MLVGLTAARSSLVGRLTSSSWPRLSTQQSGSGTPVAAVIPSVLAPVAAVIAAIFAAVVTPHGAKYGGST